MAFALLQHKKYLRENEENNEISSGESAFDEKLSAANLKIVSHSNKAELYTGVESDIKDLGQNATFGDVMKLLRRGPMQSTGTSEQKRQNATDVLQGIRTLKSMVDRADADVGPVANLLKHLIIGRQPSDSTNDNHNNINTNANTSGLLPQVMGASNDTNNRPQNGFADRVLSKRINNGGSSKTRKKPDDGAVAIPDGASIRSKGCKEVWTAKKRPPPTEEEEEEEEEAREGNENKKKNAAQCVGTKTINPDLRTSINCMAVQQTKDRAHCIIGLGCGDVRVIDLGPTRTLPDPEKEETMDSLARRATPLLLEGHEGYVSSALGVGQLCFTGSLDASIRGWKYATSEEVVKSNGHRSAVHDLCYSASNRCIYSASSDGTVRKWALAAGKSTVLCEHFDSACFSITINEKRGQLYVGLDSGNIGVVDAGSGAVISDYNGHHSMVSSLDFSSTSDLLVTGSSDGTCRIYFAGTSIVHYVHHECPIYVAVLLRNGSHVVSGGSDGAMHCWSSSTGECKTVYTHYAQETIFTLACHAGTMLVGGRDGTLRCWEATETCEFCKIRCDNGGANGNGCDWEKVKCTNECGCICYRIELSKHLLHCVKRRLRCTNPGCRDVMMYQELEKHQAETCPCTRVRCPHSKIDGGWGCKIQLRRRNLAAHLLECIDPSTVPSTVGTEVTNKQKATPPPSPGSGRRKKSDLKAIGGPTGSGVRVKIPLRNSKAGRKLAREIKRKDQNSDV